MICVCVPMASVVTVLPRMSRSSSSSGIALISQSLSRIGNCASTRPVTASTAFRTIGARKSFTFSMAARSAFPSIARWIPFVLTISPIHSMNSSANSSSSIPDRRRHAVDGEAMPFFNGRYFLNSFRCFLHHLRLLRMVVLPARKPHTMHTSTSAWSCLVFLPHLGSGTALIYSRSGFVRNPFSAQGKIHPRLFKQLLLFRIDPRYCFFFFKIQQINTFQHLQLLHPHSVFFINTPAQGGCLDCKLIVEILLRSQLPFFRKIRFRLPLPQDDRKDILPVGS